MLIGPAPIFVNWWPRWWCRCSGDKRWLKGRAINVEKRRIKRRKTTNKTSKDFFNLSIRHPHPKYSSYEVLRIWPQAPTANWCLILYNKLDWLKSKLLSVFRCFKFKNGTPNLNSTFAASTTLPFPVLEMSSRLNKLGACASVIERRRWTSNDVAFMTKKFFQTGKNGFSNEKLTANVLLVNKNTYRVPKFWKNKKSNSFINKDFFLHSTLSHRQQRTHQLSAFH